MTHVITYKGLYDAYRDCRKRKRHTANTQCYEMALLDNVFKTLADLQQQRYTPTRSIRFIVKKPKAREIYAADFSDRVVHHWLVPRLEAIFEPMFIHDVYSNRKGKGIHSAVKRLQGFMQAMANNRRFGAACETERVQMSRGEMIDGTLVDGNVVGSAGCTDPTKKCQTVGWISDSAIRHDVGCSVNKRWMASLIQPTGGTTANGRFGYFLQLDIANFFNTIDKPILFKRLQKGLSKAQRKQKISLEEAKTLRWLCHVLLKHDATKQAEYRGRGKGKQSIKQFVPKHKQLGKLGKNKGLAIGNLTSQFFANVYLNPLDQFIKHNLKCRYYCRYVDDFILLADKPETLLAWREKIIEFLATECKLHLKEIAEPKRVTQGADFLGYITFAHHRLVRRRVVGNCLEKLCHFEKQLLHGDRASGYQLRLNPPVLEGLRATLNSYWAHFKHANSFNLRKRLLQRFKWLALLFDINALLMPDCFAKHGKHVQLKNKQKGGVSVKPLWLPHPSTILGYKSQIHFFQRHFPCAQLFVQRGTQVDVFAACTHLPQAGHKASINRQVIKANIVQQGSLKGGLKRRSIHTLFIKPGVELCPS